MPDEPATFTGWSLEPTRVLAILMLAWLAYRIISRVTAPWRLFRAGRYQELKAHYATYLQSSHMWSMEDAGRLGMAACDLLLEDVEAAKQQLEQLDDERLSSPYRYSLDVLWSSILLLEGGDPREICRRVRSARECWDSPDLELTEALAWLRLGRVQDARHRLEAVEANLGNELNAGATRKGTVLLLRDPRLTAQSVLLLRGWLWALLDDVERARPLLDEATRGPVGPSRTKAQELLKTMPSRVPHQMSGTSR